VSGKCDPYLAMTLSTTKKFTTILRKYPTVLETVGEVGGTCEIIVIACGAIYMFFYFLHKKF
jgi:hypothetical protein